jgi:hypothetical protein
VVGAVVGGANGSGFRDAPLLGAVLGAFGGATNGVILMGAILGAEILLPPTRLGHALERAPFLVTFAMKFLVYGTLIVLVVGGRPGGRLVRAVAALLLSPDLAEAMYAQRAPRAVLMASTFLLLGNAIFAAPDGPPGRRTHPTRTSCSAATTARARRSDSSCSSTSLARRRSPSESARRGPSLSRRSLPTCLGPDRTIIEARSINTSATRS